MPGASTEIRKVWASRGKRMKFTIAFIFISSTVIAYVALENGLRITSALTYVIGIMAIASMTSLNFGLATAIVASVLYNFFLSEPLWQFGVDSYDDVMPLVAFNVAAVFTGVMAGRLTDRAREAEYAQAQIRALLAISDRLQQAVSLEAVAQSLLSLYKDLKVGSIALFDQFGAPIGPGDPLSPQELALVVHGASGLIQSNVTSLFIIRLANFPAVILRFEGFDEQEDAKGAAVDLEALVNLVRLAVERCILLKAQAEMEVIKRSEETKTAILSSISHDMRTPIAAISASATSLVSLPAMLETTVKESLLNTIVEQCKRLNRYTSNLLELGRIQAGIDDLSLTSVDLLDILGTVIVRFRQNNPDFVINKLYDTGSILIHANEVMVEQVLENVLDNAIRYSAENKRIDVRVDACGRHARIAVQDHGVGISQQDLPRVFERFYRGSRTETLPGSGLGLAIVKGFVERFGGEIDVESPSAQGVGTRLSIKLPLFETAQA